MTNPSQGQQAPAGASAPSTPSMPALIGTSPNIPGIVPVASVAYNAPNIIVSAAEKVGKCLSGATLILNQTTGRRMPLRDLVESKDGHVGTLGIASVISPVVPRDFVNNGLRETFRVTTQSGRFVEATANHPFLTRAGWRTLGELCVGDRIAVVVDNPVFGHGTGWFRECENGESASVKVLAYLIADGHLASTCPIFTKNEDEVREDFIAALMQYGDDWSIDERTENHSTAVRVKGLNGEKNKTKEMLESAGLNGKLSAEKFIPDRIFGMSKSLVRLFLNRLFTCDGSAEKSGRISYSSTSRRLVEQVQHLLTRFGVHCNLRDRFLHGEMYGAELVISGRDDVIRFIDEIGFFGEKARTAQKIRSEVSAIVPNPTQIDRLGPIVFDRIVNIELAGEQNVFDLEIDGTHNFIANDFVVHNSSLAVTLFGFPEPHHQPLVLAIDESGPDSCINLGYAVHAIKVRTLPGASWFEKLRATLDMLEKNIQSIRQQYGSLVFDCASLATYRLLEDARRRSKNPDPRSHYQTMYTQFNEVWWRICDLQMPTVWLAWTGEGGMNDNGVNELAAPDIAGKRFARTIAGRSQHNFVLEKRFIGKGSEGADPHGYGRVIHSLPWNGQNAGGRFGHLLPELCPPNLSFIFRAVRGSK